MLNIFVLFLMKEWLLNVLIHLQTFLKLCVTMSQLQSHQIRSLTKEIQQALSPKCLQQFVNNICTKLS